MLHEIAKAVATNTTTVPAAGNGIHRRERSEGIVQVVISAAATVVIQGSNDGTNWTTIDTFTASGGKIIAIFAQTRAVISGNTGTVTVTLAEPE